LDKKNALKNQKLHFTPTHTAYSNKITGLDKDKNFNVPKISFDYTWMPRYCFICQWFTCIPLHLDENYKQE